VVPGSDGLLSPASAPNSPVHFCSGDVMNAHYYSVLTTPFDMVNAHYVIIDFRGKFAIKIQTQASDTSRTLPSFSSAPFLQRAVPSERLGQVYNLASSFENTPPGGEDLHWNEGLSKQHDKIHDINRNDYFNIMLYSTINKY
jgi:hypothetical protein